MFWAAQLAGPVIMLGLAAINVTHGQGWAAVSELAFMGACGIYIANTMIWYGHGYRRGMDDFAEALTRSESPEEFIRLTLGTPVPKPWE
jgi:hypothetical protein